MDFISQLNNCLSYLVEYTIVDVAFLLEETKGLGKIKIVIYFKKDLSKNRDNIEQIAKQVLNDKFNLNNQTASNIAMAIVSNKARWEITAVVTVKADFITKLMEWWKENKNKYEKVSIEVLNMPKEKPEIPEVQQTDPMIETLRETIINQKKLENLIKVWNSYNITNRTDVNFMEKFISTNIDHLSTAMISPLGKELFRKNLNERIAVKSHA